MVGDERKDEERNWKSEAMFGLNADSFSTGEKQRMVFSGDHQKGYFRDYGTCMGKSHMA